MKKVFKNLAIFTCIGIIITLPTLIFIDRFIYSLSQTSSIILPSTSKEEVSSFTLLDGAESVQYSYDNKYYTFLKDDKVYIYDSEKNEEIKVIEEELPICYYNLLYDKNLIIYFTQDEDTKSSKLTLKTYEIETERSSEYNKITINNFSKIKDMSMSPIINIIYVNIETKSGVRTNNIVYRIDLFNSITSVKSGIIVDKMVMLQQKDRVYYEDADSNIYMGSTKITIFGEKVHLIGSDLNDNVYFISKNDKDVVYKVKNNVIVDKIELSDTDIVTTYSNYESVYLVYPTYVMEVSSKDPYRRVGRVSNYFTFEAVKDDIIYLKTNEEIVVKQEISTYD